MTTSKALLHFLNRELSRGWHAWHSIWAVLKAKRESLRKSLAHLLNRNLSRGWGAWLEMALQRKSFMQKLRKASATWSIGSLHSDSLAGCPVLMATLQ